MNIIGFGLPRFGMSTNEDNFWAVIFSLDTLIFLGILVLLLWGLYTYFRNRKGEERADRRFERDLDEVKADDEHEGLSNDREYIQAQLREEEFNEYYNNPTDDTYKPKED
jgi:hypothetical protein